MKCPNCQTPVGAPEWKARKHTLWSNNSGNKVRIFCDECGQWTDVKTVYGSSLELTTTTINVIHPPPPDYKPTK